MARRQLQGEIMSEPTKRKLYKETPVSTLNEDGTNKTLPQKIDELNTFIKKALKEMENTNENR